MAENVPAAIKNEYRRIGILNTLWHKYFLAAITTAIIVTPGIASTPGSSRAPDPAFRPVLSALIGHTTIPILLPSWLPAGATGRWADSFVGADAYAVSLPDQVEHIENAPHDWHTVEAKRIGPRMLPLEGVPITLSRGRVGYYQESEWAARPSDASVTWIQKGVQYTVGEYAGTKEDVVRMANSVVEVGGGLPPPLRRALPKLRAAGIGSVLLPTYLPPFGKPLIGWQNLKPVMKTEASEDGYLISFWSPQDKYDDDMATLDVVRVSPVFGSLLGKPVTISMWASSKDPDTRKVQVFVGPLNPRYPYSSAVVAWETGGFRYKFAWRGASEAQMIHMAESCVPVRFSAKARKQTRTEMP